MLGRLLNRVAAPPLMEKRVVQLLSQHISYTLKRSGKRRSIGLRIDDRGLTVSMPLKASEHWLNEVLQHRAGWVLEKLGDWQVRQATKLCFADGECIPYLGELLTLRVVDKVRSACLVGDALHVAGGRSAQDLSLACIDEDAARIERQVSRWYRQQAIALFRTRAAHFAPLLAVFPCEVSLSSAKTRWGSCTSAGVIRLNVQLIKLPQYLIDYVVVHELSHLREMNHSAAFWAVVASVCPDYLSLRRELKGCSLR